MLPPLVLTAVLRGESIAILDTIEHLRITHDSRRLEGAAQVYCSMLLSLLNGVSPLVASERAGRSLGLNLEALVSHAERSKLTDSEVVQNLGLACYIGHSLPTILFPFHRHFSRAPDKAFANALLSNTNAGGENCHRGSALGALLGAAGGLAAIPHGWRENLTAYTAIQGEIAAFIDQLLPATPSSAPHRQREL